jgi:hypothetical protein
MKRILTLTLFICAYISGCTKDEIKFDPDNLLIGIWNFSEYNLQYDAYIYFRSNEFIDGHCYQFNSDGTLLERKNAGWCGTPPISYADYAGYWTILNDTLLRIEVAYWGGNTRYDLDIESLDEDSMSVIQRPVSDLEDPE